MNDQILLLYILGFLQAIIILFLGIAIHSIQRMRSELSGVFERIRGIEKLSDERFIMLTKSVDRLVERQDRVDTNG